MVDEATRSRRAAALFVGAGLVVGLVAGLLIFYGLPAFTTARTSSAAPGPKATSAPAPVVDAPAPDFTLTALSGGEVTLSDLKGKVVLVNFWATWCGPCEAEMPAIEARYKLYKESGLEVLAVNLDETEAEIRPFVERLGLTFPILLDPGGVVNEQYRVRGYPTTFIVGRDGIILAQKVGYMTDGQLDTYLSEAGFGGQ